MRPMLILTLSFPQGLRTTVNDDGVWRIRRAPRSQVVEVFRLEEAGHGGVLTDDFINWRIRLSMGNPVDEQPT